MRILPFALLIALFMTACASIAKTPELNGSSWNVEVIVDADSTIVIAGQELPSLTFTNSTDFNAHTPCNSIAGVYTINDKGKIELITQSSTMALCHDITYESSLIRALENVKFFTIDSDTLRFKDVEGRVIVKLSSK